MPLRIEPQAEPISGYRLIERLGSGGFGEVWKAEAPGGLFKAIKFVQRTGPAEESAIANTDTERSRADQELKSLSRVKAVHHPYVLSLDRFEIVDDYLVIVMELADRTLSDRFKQCRGQGLPGVPREELLNYLHEAAEALDLMNSLYQLQHLDIKPQNLFLVHSHIKVADFGLVKDITDQKFMTITGGVTPVYAAPETFDGKFSRQSDQYSLAIVYQEILTGTRPFTGTTMKQLILQHLQNAHDLTPAPVHDRPIIARALSKNPEDRFATCLDFIETLQRAGGKTHQAVKPPQAKAPGPAPAPSPGDECKTESARGNAGPVRTVEPNFSVAKAFLNEDDRGPHGKKEHLPPLPSLPSVRTAPSFAKSSRRLSQPKPVYTGVVQPALVIGMGKLGVDTLKQLRQRIATEFGTPFALSHVRVLAIDADPESLQNAAHVGDVITLRNQETVLARLQRASHYLKTRDGKLPTDNWLNPKVLYRIPRKQSNAGLRALGRLAFIDNYRAISRRIEAELITLCSQDTPHDVPYECDLGLRTSKPRIYLVTSLTGNTGSGMFLDMAYLIRRLLNEQGHAEGEIVGLFFVPNVQREGISIPLSNAHAALRELKHYCRPESIYTAHYSTAASLLKEKSNQTGAALQRCVLVPLPQVRSNPDAADNRPALANAGDFLFRDLATSLGQTIDAERNALRQRLDTAPEPQKLKLQSFGMKRVQWPRHDVLEHAGRRLCTQLVTRWMQKDAKELSGPIRQWTHECWESLGLRPEQLIERFQQMCEQALQQKPELVLAEILVPAQNALDLPKPVPATKDAAASKVKVHVNMGPVLQTMEQLEGVLGIPEEVRSSRQANAEPTLFERAFAEIAHVIADECEQKLAELAVALLEDPNYRLAGAEEALRQFNAIVEKALQSQESLAKELTEKAGQLHVRIQQWIDKPLPPNAPTATQWSFGLTRRSAPRQAMQGPSDLFELIRTYTKTRYHSMVLSHLNRLYVGLRGHLSDQIREVGFCRQRLGELASLLKPVVLKNEDGPADPHTLFPPGCLRLKDAVEQLVQSVTPDDLIRFDEQVQFWIKNQYQALLQICMGTSTVVKNVAPAMLLEAEDFLAERLDGESVAEMYLSRKRAEHGDNAPTAMVNELLDRLEDAVPTIGKLTRDNQITVISLPDNPHGAELQKLLKGEIHDAKIIMSDRQDEMLFYHEIVSLRWEDIPQLGPIAAEIYQQRCAIDPSGLHSRDDVFDWQIMLAAAQ